MSQSDYFDTISPGMARERFLVKDDQWEARFRPNFGQFIVATFEFARPVIKLPVPAARTANHALFLVTGGQLEMTIGSQAYTFDPGQLVSVPARQIFSIIDIRDDTTGFMCFFSNDLLINTVSDTDFGFLKLTSQPAVSLPDVQLRFVDTLFERLGQEYTESGASKSDIIGPYLLALLAEINRAYALTAPPPTDTGDRLVQRFTDLLTTYIREKRLVSDYADMLHVSANHLNKVVKARTGQSPSVWISERIVLEAKVWLFQSDLTIAQIAGELGFDDQSNFGKLFKKYARTSPASFRKMIDFNQPLPGMS